MLYEWDENKNRLNQRKHGGISFQMAAAVFEDSYHIDKTGKQRWHAIGAAHAELGTVAVLFVVHVYREARNGEDVIRIISARKANQHEIRRYKEQTMD